jgi:hypothetical protein
MLIPRFSLRWLLGLTTVFAFLSLIWSFAFRGQAWALGFSAGLNGLVLLFAFHAGAFLVAWLFVQGSSGVAALGNAPAEGSPFAAESPFARPASDSLPPSKDAGA